MSPGVFLGKPDDFSSVPQELIEAEMAGLNAVYDGDEDHALMAAGEVAQRIEDLPTAQELVEGIMGEAMKVVSTFPDRFVVE